MHQRARTGTDVLMYVYTCTCRSHIGSSCPRHRCVSSPPSHARLFGLVWGGGVLCLGTQCCAGHCFPRVWCLVIAAGSPEPAQQPMSIDKAVRLLNGRRSATRSSDCVVAAGPPQRSHCCWELSSFGSWGPRTSSASSEASAPRGA